MSVEFATPKDLQALSLRILNLQELGTPVGQVAADVEVATSLATHITKPLSHSVII